MKLFSINELNQRIERFRGYLSGLGIDCAVLTSNQDLFYFTGSVQRGALIIQTEGETTYFVRKNFERACDESPLNIEPWSNESIKKMIKGRWSMAMDITTVSEYFFYKSKFSLDMDAKDCSNALSLTKTVKSEKEIEFIKRAGCMNISIMEFAKKIYYPGITDIEIQAEIESYAKKKLSHQGLFWIRGSNMEGSMGLVVTGKDSLAPTYTDFPIGGTGLSPAVAQGASGIRVDKSFVIDFIGSSYGYCADSTRTFFVGKPDEKIVDIYGELNNLLGRTVEKVIPGVTGEEIYDFIINEVEKYSWKDYFMGYHQKVKFVGHGIGTEVNQLPVIAPKQNLSFEDGMVIAIEPKIFLPDHGVIGIENTYILENGKLISVTGNCSNIENWIVQHR
jgi:Xaa-Pro dipeptidase